MKQSKLEALLGRPLTTIEATNIKLYLTIAKERVEELTCLNLTENTEDRTYDIREGYSTVFTDLFTTLNSVKIDGVELASTKYSIRQWDKRNAQWYNSIILDNCKDKEVTINANWGICAPDMQLLTAKAFDSISKMNTSNNNVKSKRVEDFSITFKDETAYESFVSENQPLIDKYSLCNIGQIRHGEVRDYREQI